MSVQPQAPVTAGGSKIETMLSEFARYVIKRLPLMLLTFAISSAAHLYLIYLNNGYDAGKVTKWTSYINVGSNPGSSAFMIWTAVSALGWSFVYTLFKQGPVRAVTSIVAQPINMVKKLATSSTLEYACWALGGGCALIAAAVLGTNRPAGLTMGLLWVMLGMSRAGQAVAQFIFTGLVQVLSGQLGRFRPSVQVIQIVIAAVGPGFMIAGLLNVSVLQFLIGLLALVISLVLFLIGAGKDKSQSVAQAAGQASVLVMVSGLSAIFYALIGLLWPRWAFANDFGQAENGSFWNALKSGSDAVKGAVTNAVKGSAGTGLAPLAPAIQPPRVYGPNDPEAGKKRPNPWDPDGDTQKKMWIKDHVIWDPKTLEWRPPTPGEYPPPVSPPETPTPYQQQMPRDQVPPECLDLYDRYVKAQDVALHGADDLKAASDAYWEAQRRYNELLAKWTLITGAEFGQIAAGGVEAVHGASTAARGAGRAAVDSIRESAQSGLREIADRAAVEAAAADAEIASQGAMALQLRQASLGATAELGSATEALNTLKASRGNLTEAEDAVDSANGELEAADKAVAEAEGEALLARNRMDRANRGMALEKEVTARESERLKLRDETSELSGDWDAKQREYRSAESRELSAKTNARVADLMQEESELNSRRGALLRQKQQISRDIASRVKDEMSALDSQIEALDAERRSFNKRVSPNRTLNPGELTGADLEEYQRLDGQIRPLKERRSTLQQMTDSPETPELQQIQSQLDAIAQRQDELLTMKDGEGFRNAAEAQVKAEPRSAGLQDMKAEVDRLKKMADDKFDELTAKEAELDRLKSRIDPTYADESNYAALEQQLERMQKAASDARAAQQSARAKLSEAKQNLARAQQEAGSLTDNIASQEKKVAELQQKVNDLTEQGSQAEKQLRASEQKKADATRRQQDALNSMKDDQGAAGAPPSDRVASDVADSINKGASTGGAPPLPPTSPGGGRPMVNPRTGEVIPLDRNFDPYAASVERWKPGWAYWVEEKLRNGGEFVGEKLKKGFGVQSPDEIAQIMAQAKATLESKYQTLQEKMAAYGAASGDLGMNIKPGDDYWKRFGDEAKTGLKSQLDQCIQSHTYWKGDAAAGGSQAGQ